MFPWVQCVDADSYYLMGATKTFQRSPKTGITAMNS